MFAYIPVSPTFPGVVADMLAAGINVFAGSFQSGPGAVGHRARGAGLVPRAARPDPAAEGVIASGGSTANLVGLTWRATAVPTAVPARVAYVTTEAHSSVGRALRLIGIEQVHDVAVDERFRMCPDALAEAMAADDRAAGLVPWCVVAAAGSTNTGAVDDLPALHRVADEHGAWLHVDAAYGGFLALTERGRAAMPGLEPRRHPGARRAQVALLPAPGGRRVRPRRRRSRDGRSRSARRT